MTRTRTKKNPIASMKKAIELNPKNAAALNYLGYTWAEMGVQLDEAEDLITTRAQNSAQRRLLHRQPGLGLLSERAIIRAPSNSLNAPSSSRWTIRRSSSISPTPMKRSAGPIARVTRYREALKRIQRSRTDQAHSRKNPAAGEKDLIRLLPPRRGLLGFGHLPILTIHNASDRTRRLRDGDPAAAPKPPVPQWESSKLIESMSQRNEQFRSLRALGSGRLRRTGRQARFPGSGSRAAARPLALGDADLSGRDPHRYGQR